MTQKINKYLSLENVSQATVKIEEKSAHQSLAKNLPCQGHYMAMTQKINKHLSLENISHTVIRIEEKSAHRLLALSRTLYGHDTINKQNFHFIPCYPGIINPAHLYL